MCAFVEIEHPIRVMHKFNIFFRLKQKQRNAWSITDNMYEQNRALTRCYFIYMSKDILLKFTLNTAVCQ